MTRDFQNPGLLSASLTGGGLCPQDMQTVGGLGLVASLVKPLSNESLAVLKLNLKTHQQANEQKENGKQTHLNKQLAGLPNTFPVGGLSVPASLD